jgi:flagellar biosynthesis/type III secretory pathway protein FliH
LASSENEPEEEDIDLKAEGDSESGERSSKEEASQANQGRVRIALLGFVVAVVSGVGGYLIGNSTGEDLDAARAQGQEAGEKAGAARGAAKGFATGFKKGRDKGFGKAYAPSYKKSYAQAFEDSGLEKPSKSEIKVPKK